MAEHNPLWERRCDGSTCSRKRCNSQKLADWCSAFASKPAPTLSYHCVFPIQRLTAMTAPTDTLLATLEHCDMVEIDGLHAFEFSLDEDDNLHIECLDGRVSKHWEFTPAEVEAATFDPDLQSWLITGSSGEHRLVCMTAFRGDDDEEEANEDA